MQIMELTSQSLLLHMKINDVQLSSGTGFILESAIGPLLITNRHNVTGRDNDTGELLGRTAPEQISIHHNKLNPRGFIWKTENLYDDDYTPRWIEHPHFGKLADFVALPLEDIDNVRFIYYNHFWSGTSEKLMPADRVSVIGYPFGIAAGKFHAIWVSGFIATDLDINYGDLPRFLIDCRGRPGQSGSPVIGHGTIKTYVRHDDPTIKIEKASMQFMGIYSGRINKESDIGIVWKESAIRELLDFINTKIEKS